MDLGPPAHRAFQEATLGSSGIGPLEWYFDQGPFPVAGAKGVPDATSWDARAAYPDPDDPAYVPVGIGGVFATTSLPSYRLRIDMSDLDGAGIVITTGQSGNPGDGHYGDLIETWRTGATVPLPFSPRRDPGGRGVHADPRLPDALRASATRRPPFASDYSLISSGPSGTSIIDPPVLDDHRVHGQRLLGRRVERLAALEVEPGQVERAGQRAVGQEPLVELEVLVRADALEARGTHHSC